MPKREDIKSATSKLAEAREKAVAAERCQRDFTGCKVLVVDDDDLSREILVEILKDYGGDETGLTIEPHLKVFAGLNALQGEELHHKYAYSDNRTAFRAAVDAVKSILTDAGYREGEANRWIK